MFILLLKSQDEGSGSSSGGGAQACSSAYDSISSKPQKLVEILNDFLGKPLQSIHKSSTPSLSESNKSDASRNRMVSVTIEMK